jgi:hypothetical protein
MVVAISAKNSKGSLDVEVCQVKNEEVNIDHFTDFPLYSTNLNLTFINSAVFSTVQ